VGTLPFWKKMAQFTTKKDLVSSNLMTNFLFASVHLFTEAALEKEAQRIQASSAASPPTPTSETSATTASTAPAAAITNMATAQPPPDVLRKLENMGFCVGRRLIERQTRDDPPKRLENNMSIMRYICKDFWPLAFDHGASRLRTNHRGIFVIEDATFRFIEAIGPMEGINDKDAILKYLFYPCGLLRGALASLGVACIVDANVDALPVVQFHVQVAPMMPST